MKTRALVSLAMAALLTASLYAAEKADLKGIKCPVSGKPAAEDHSVSYKGAKVYFCCPNCPKAFEKDTAKFATKANHQLAATGQAKQVKCPLSGEDLNEATAIKVDGVEVAFCCNNCKGKIQKSKSDEQVVLIFSDAAFKKAFEVEKE